MGRKNRELRRLKHQQVIARRVQYFEGPLPAPEILVKYNDAVPNGAERLLTMAEGQATHRQSLEDALVQGNIKAQARAQRYGLIIILVIVGIGAWLLHEGKDLYGFGAILASLASLVGVFMWGRYRQEKERQQKAEQFQGQPSG